MYLLLPLMNSAWNFSEIAIYSLVSYIVYAWDSQFVLYCQSTALIWHLTHVSYLSHLRDTYILPYTYATDSLTLQAAYIVHIDSS